MSAERTPSERARRLIDAAVNLTLATADADGRPWVAPVFYVPDERCDLFWTSEPAARHSANIRARSEVAIVIVEPDPDARVDAVYLSAQAVELTADADIERAIAVMATKPQPEQWTISDRRDVTGDGPWRIYRAHPLEITVRSTERRGAKPVARRVDAEFRER